MEENGWIEELSQEEVEEIDRYTDDDLTDENLLISVGSNSEVKSALKQYLQDIGYYKLLTVEEESKINERIKAGDESARQLLTVHYLRLVVKVATRLKNIATSFEFNDLIQEGNIGLVEAANKYDPDRKIKFVTYAYSMIRFYILNVVNRYDSKVTISAYLKTNYEKYRRYKGKYFSENGFYPSKEAVMETLGITEKVYQGIMQYEKNIKGIRSTNELIGEERDGGQLEDFIPSIENGFHSFENEMDKKILMYKVKNVVTPLEYYVLYYRIFCDSPLTLKTLAEDFFITRSRMDQIEKKAFSKIKNILYRSHKQIHINFNHLNKESFVPVSLYTVIRLRKLKEVLNDYDYYLIYSVWYEKVEITQLSYNTGITVAKLNVQLTSLLEKYGTYLRDDSIIREELTKVMDDQRLTEIYNSFPKLMPVYNAIEETLKSVQNMSYEEARKMIGDKYNRFTPNQKELFDSYFDRSFVPIRPSTLNKVSNFINAQILGYYNSRYLSPEKLYPVLLEHKNKFSPDNYEALLCTYFKGLSKMKTDRKELQLRHLSFSLHRLESYYYHLDRYYYYDIPVNDVAEIISNPRYQFTEKQKELVRLKYGIGCRVYSPLELASMENMEYNSFRDMFSAIHRKILHIYVGMNRFYDVYDSDRYLPFISNPQYVMTEETRQACYYYFVEKKDYKEIMQLMNIKNTVRVSNIITEAIRKMDFWYYGMVDFPLLDRDKAKQTLNSGQYQYTEEALLIIESRYIKEMISPEEISNRFQIDKKRVKGVLSLFLWQYVSYNTRNCFTEEQIKEEVLCHITDSILTEKEREIASFYYGIQCEYNPTGRQLYGKEISELLGENQDKVYNYIESIKHRIGSRILKISKPLFGDIPRSEIVKLLNDPHVPITDYEKELLKAVKGIGCEVQLIEDLAKKYEVNSGSIFRRVKRAMLSLKKYEAGELEPKINYELDVVPNLKYFPLFAQNILIRRYRDHDTNKEIGIDLGVTIASSENIVMKIERKFLYYLKNKKAKKFDFDYARSVFDKKDFPFYGDLKKAISVYNRTFGDDGLRPEGRIDLEFLDEAEKSVTSFSNNRLMVAVLKYRDGIRKLPSISYEELREFYERNKETYSASDRNKFERNLRDLTNKSGLIFEKGIKNSFVIIEFLKGRKELPFDFDCITRSDAKNLVVNNPYHLSKFRKRIILDKYQITRHELMSGKNQLRLLKLIEEDALKYHSNKVAILEEKKSKGRKDAEEMRFINKDLLAPYLNTVDMHYALENISKDHSSVLIPNPMIDLVFAHIRQHHYDIDVITMDKLYEYVYLLQKYVLEKKDHYSFYEFFNSPIYSNIGDLIPNMDEQTKAFWETVFAKQKNQELFITPYSKKDLSSIRILHACVPFLRIKNKINLANVHFYEDIPDKYYSQIDIADEIDTASVKDAKEILKIYKDYLIQGGEIISYFRKQQSDIPEIFDGENYSVYDARPVRKGMLKANYETTDKIIVLRK